MEFTFPTNIENPLQYAGSYECRATSKYGTDHKLIDFVYKPKEKPLTVMLASNAVELKMDSGVKVAMIETGKTLEVIVIFFILYYTFIVNKRTLL